MGRLERREGAKTFPFFFTINKGRGVVGGAIKHEFCFQGKYCKCLKGGAQMAGRPHTVRGRQGTKQDTHKKNIKKKSLGKMPPERPTGI